MSGQWETDWCAYVHFLVWVLLCFLVWLCMYTCINSYCLLSDYDHGRILYLVLFVEMYVYVVLSSCLYSALSLMCVRLRE